MLELRSAEEEAGSDKGSADLDSSSPGASYSKLLHAIYLCLLVQQVIEGSLP
jgi:hypothetical protein